MIKCEPLVEALNGNYKGTYQEFEESIVNFVKQHMKSLCSDKQYDPVCVVKENLQYIGITIGVDKILFDKEAIKNLKSGKKIYLIVLFHELSHIEQNIQIANGVATPNIIKYIKDSLLRIYQDLENERFGYSSISISYNKINYNCLSNEIDADLNAIILMIKFMAENNIDFSKEKPALKKYFSLLQERKRKPRNLENICTFNSRYLSLDDAFDVAIKKHPEWLNIFPQLNIEYSLENGIIKKITDPNYQEYDINSDKYHIYKYIYKQGAF